jgi:OOP family OmpA-OmpF porin
LLLTKYNFDKPISLNKQSVMVNKKYLLLSGLCSILAFQPAMAQESQATSAKWGSRDMTYRGENYDVLDSNYVPRSRMAQHRKFLNHQYAFPAKPRSMWEVGVKAGLYNVSGDVPSLTLWHKGGYGFGVHIRKSLGYTFSTRLEYTYGIAKGLGWQGSTNYSRNRAWMQSGLYQPINFGASNIPDVVFDNYRMESHALNLDVMASLANIKFHKATSSVSFYVFAGLGAFAYKTYVNTMNESYQKYDFETIVPPTLAQRETNRKEIRSKLQDAMDKSYETDAESYQGRRSTMGNKVVEFEYSFGAGIAFKLNKRVNIAIEDRVLTPWSDDLLDGERWAAQVSGAPVLTSKNDGVNFFSVGLNFNLGNMRKKVAPLYWINPLDHLYNEIGYPRHMILPEPILSDADGDGIADQFDKCPGTPAGVAVDSHGCPMDTDGDGVPDDRDKELITPTYCQPVDADGVGKCPCPEGCGAVATSACGNIGAGSVTFDKNMSKIRPASQAQLATLAAQMQANPTCKVVITGAGNASKMAQQRSWDRVNSIIEYMSEKHGIDRNRFIFQYGQAGDETGVMYRSAMPGEEGPANVAPPFPNLKK